MRRQPIEFRDLIERLLPLDRLAPAERARVEQALASGDPSRIERQALEALYLLEQRGALRRVPPGAARDGVVRFQTSRSMDLIALELPPTLRRDGIEIHPRVALLPSARTGIDSVRRLMRLDDPLVFSDPRHGNPRLALIELLDQTGRELTGADSIWFFPRHREEGIEERPPFDAPLALQARSDERIVIASPDTARAPTLASAGAARGVRSLALAGVFSDEGEAIGHLEAVSGKPECFGKDELALVAVLADCCAFAWERSSRIEQLMFLDPMTGAFNRSYFDRQLLNEMARAARERSSFALGIADVDNFKSFNTAHGYEAGNVVLEHVARTLQSGVRPFDTVARWGGEEFAILLTAPIHAEDAATVFERLRTLVERREVPIESLDGARHTLAVTVSIGVALYPGDAATPHELFRAANQALLTAKLPPKNRVVYFRPPGERAGTR